MWNGYVNGFVWVSLASQRKVTRLTVPIRWNEHGGAGYAYIRRQSFQFPFMHSCSLLALLSHLHTPHTHAHILSDGTRMLSESSIHPTCVCGWKSTASFNLAELIVLCFSLLLHMTKCVMCIERHCTHTRYTHRHLLGLPYIYVFCSHVCCVVRVLMMPEMERLKASEWVNELVS